MTTNYSSCSTPPLAKAAVNMDEELNQCLNSIPGFVVQLEEQRYTTDLNLMEWFIMRAELFLGLLRVLTGKPHPVYIFIC